MSEPIVLGIESTCDETAAAVVQGRTLISNVVASSMDDHARYGGVIPEIASRAHAEAFVPCVSKALADADIRGESAGLGREQTDLWHQSCHWAHRRHPTAVRPVSQGHACADRVRRPHFAAAR